MKKALLASALIAALGTSASAQGIQPVQSGTVGTDTVVSTAGPELGLTPGAIAAGIAGLIVVVAIASESNSSDGT